MTDDALRSLNKTGTTAENTIGVTGVDLDGKLGGTFGFYNDNSGSITLMHLPMVASNFETRYESYMIGTIGNTRFIGF